MLREVTAAGINHNDTSDFYGPHNTDQIIKDSLHPYSDSLFLVAYVGASQALVADSRA